MKVAGFTDFLFGGVDPRSKKMKVPVEINTSGHLTFEGGARIDAYICAGGAKGSVNFISKLGHVSAMTSKGGRKYQEDAFYIAKILYPDGKEVLVEAVFDGMGGIPGGEIASSAAAQGLHAGVVKAVFNGRIPLAGEIFEDAGIAVQSQRMQHQNASGANAVASVIVFFEDEGTAAIAGDAMLILYSKTSTGAYEVVGYSNVDSFNQNIVTNSVIGMPRLYFFRQLSPDDQIILGSDGLYGNILGIDYKFRGSELIRSSSLFLFPPDQALFASLTAFCNTTEPNRSLARRLHGIAELRMKSRRLTLNLGGQSLKFSSSPDTDNLTALTHRHCFDPKQKTQSLVLSPEYLPLEPVY